LLLLSLFRKCYPAVERQEDRFKVVTEAKDWRAVAAMFTEMGADIERWGRTAGWQQQQRPTAVHMLLSCSLLLSCYRVLLCNWCIC